MQNAISTWQTGEKVKGTKRRQRIYNGIWITGIKISRFFAATF